MTAIAYYKQAISGVEQVRQKNQGLPPELQTSFLYSGRKGETTADTYRELADVLLSQGRILEAQDVLELLKVQEIRDFTQTRGKTPEAETVLKFRQLLEAPNSNITELQATGKQPYDWLILPLEAELKKNKIQNLVFSLDRATRYIPMSALFDGEKYLIENYAVSTILSADLTNTSDRIPPGTENTSILALGLSNPFPGFNPLPNVPAELDAIVRKQPNDTKGIYPGLKFLNQDTASSTKSCARQPTNTTQYLPTSKFRACT